MLYSQYVLLMCAVAFVVGALGLMDKTAKEDQRAGSTALALVPVLICFGALLLYVVQGIAESFGITLGSM